MSDVTLQFSGRGEPVEEGHEIEVEVGDEVSISTYENLRVTGKTTPREELITGVAALVRDEGWDVAINEIADEVARQEET